VRWARFHVAIAALVCVVVPAESWLFGSGSRAWTMYARSASFRIRITAFDEHGIPRWISPSEIAAHSEGDLASVLGGAESFRVGPEGFSLRERRRSLARFACETSGASRVSLTISIRAHDGDPAEDTVEEQACRAP
jgi:hypothetical protein